MSAIQVYNVSTRSELADALVKVSADGDVYVSIFYSGSEVYGRVRGLDLAEIFDRAGGTNARVTVGAEPIAEELEITGMHRDEFPESFEVVDATFNKDYVVLHTRGDRGARWSAESGVIRWARVRSAMPDGFPCIATFTLDVGDEGFVIETETAFGFDVKEYLLDDY